MHDLEKFNAVGIRRSIVGCQSEDFLYPQVHPAFAGANVTNSFEEFVEVVGNPRSFNGRILQPLVVHRKALYEVLAQPLGGPAAELHPARGADSVANGEDGVQTIVFNQPGNVPASLDSNYPEFPDSCPRIELPFFKKVLEVFVDRPHILPEQFGHQGLGEPYGFACEPALDSAPTVLGRVEDHFAGGWRWFPSPCCWRMATFARQPAELETISKSAVLLRTRQTEVASRCFRENYAAGFEHLRRRPLSRA